MTTTYQLGLIAADLKAALKRPGCAICRLRRDAEARYLRFLLWENVNDLETREHIGNGLGFCPQHTWQMAEMEPRRFGSDLGNAIIYEGLTGLVQGRLVAYLLRIQEHKGSIWPGWLRRLGLGRWPAPTELEPSAPCRVCQTGEQNQASELIWLLQGLSAPDCPYRGWYAASDQLCLAHLRQALALTTPATEPGAEWLARLALQRLDDLRADLDEYGDKQSWQRRHDPPTASEAAACPRAWRFFGGNNDEHDG
jgi:hypothetical protein